MEIVYRTKDLFNKFKVYTLNDLRNKNCYVKMFKDYLKRFDKDLILVDSYDGDGKIHTEADRTKIIEYTNPAFWRKLKVLNYSYKKKRRYRLEFENLISNYGLDSNKVYIRELLMEKFHTLLNS